MGSEQRRGVLITGGGSGIGLAMAVEFLKLGYDVAICGRDPERLAAAKAKHPGLRTMQADVARSEEHARLATWLATHVPHLSVLVNNAGIMHASDFRGSVRLSEIRSELDTNLLAPIALTAALLPMLARNDKPTVVNVTSGLAFCPSAEFPVYCATKAALHSFTLSLRHQLTGRVRVVEIAPPIVATGLDKRNQDRRPAEGAGPPVLSAETFASEAVERLEQGEAEIVIGVANGLRQRGEALFADMNP
ncbi:SDR family NAD(P)-dependent oxidoreductase [Archangium violaceum]|uniref:SDR family oxidoreductase n=1 Tax=Archangium violaceum TaxID=83451 RepID=UPI0019516B2F|nr:SDR family NAD(P)-dependent oxidoreductase [Archangium violaceum]QRN97004.1 SDR family NAD(P)-dependent oxidoreductase [Archangium violaceum]